MEGWNNVQNKLQAQVSQILRKRVLAFAKTFLQVAFSNRAHGDGHNYTGNLINSILVAVYENGNPVKAMFAGKEFNLKPVRQGKMTTTKRGNARTYHFAPDYDGDMSSYKAEVKTNEGRGLDDAVKFVNTYKPSGRDIFHIVFAIPVEYADYITTSGFDETVAFAEMNAKQMLDNNFETPPIEFSTY